jgi:hypothetical protein
MYRTVTNNAEMAADKGQRELTEVNAFISEWVATQFSFRPSLLVILYGARSIASGQCGGRSDTSYVEWVRFE